MSTIKSMSRLENTIWRSGGSGDNWHMTWAKDDRQYVSLCDGKGWEPMPYYNDKDYNSRIYILDGSSPLVSWQYLAGYPDLLTEEPPNRFRYYNFGIIALDTYLYSFLSTPNVPFHLAGPKFAGAKLIYSPDLGKTWLNQDGGALIWEDWASRSCENMIFWQEPGDAFSLLTVLQMGRDYQYNTDGYVYIYAPNGNLEGAMNQLVMCRVPKDRIRNRCDYEFFVSRNLDGTAYWSSNIQDRGVVYEFPHGWVNTRIHPYAWHPSVVYYPATGEYLMANWGMGVAPDGGWFGKPSYLGFWTAPQPWGPWTQVHEETSWTPANDINARAYQPQISPKWIAADGNSFWLVWTDFMIVDGKLPNYCFNMQRVAVEL